MTQPKSGADNELWSFGEAVYKLLRGLLALRERLRPYIHELAQIASDQGLPLLWPLFFEFPDDPLCETREDQFMLGPELLVAPVLHENARQRRVYLPAGTNWMDAGNGKTFQGGQYIEVSAPLETIPVFLKFRSHLISIFQNS